MLHNRCGRLRELMGLTRFIRIRIAPNPKWPRKPDSHVSRALLVFPKHEVAEGLIEWVALLGKLHDNGNVIAILAEQ